MNRANVLKTCFILLAVLLFAIANAYSLSTDCQSLSSSALNKIKDAEFCPNNVVNYVRSAGDVNIKNQNEGEIDDCITLADRNYDGEADVIIKRKSMLIIEFVPHEEERQIVASEIYFAHDKIVVNLSEAEIIQLTYIFVNTLVGDSGCAGGSKTVMTGADGRIRQGGAETGASSGAVISLPEIKTSLHRDYLIEAITGITANLTYIGRMQLEIDVTPAWGMGSSIFIRGPAPRPNPRLTRGAHSWGEDEQKRDSDPGTARIQDTVPGPEFLFNYKGNTNNIFLFMAGGAS